MGGEFQGFTLIIVRFAAKDIDVEQAVVFAGLSGGLIDAQVRAAESNKDIKERSCWGEQCYPCPTW
jgi:hypothetical protein